MRPQYLCYTFAACCLIKLVSCEHHSQNIPSSNKSTIVVAAEHVLANHRMNSQEVPKTNATQTTNEVNATLAGPSPLDFPFNVDFVDQPEMFEVGQSFFLPTIKSPPDIHISRPRGNNRSSGGRWSLPLDVGAVSAQPAPYQPVANSSSSPKSRYIVFDDENEDNWASSQAAVATPFNQSHVGQEVASDSMRFKQLKLDLDKHEAEKRKLLTLLGRRLGAQSQDEAARSVWINPGDKLVPLPQSSGLIRGLVPANHVVEHPKSTHKLKHAPRHRLGATNRHYLESDSARKPDMETSLFKRDRANPVRYSLPVYAASTGTLTDASPPIGAQMGSNTPSNSGAVTSVKQHSTSVELQPVGEQPGEESELKQAVRDYFSSLNPNAFASLPGASTFAFSKTHKLYPELSPDLGLSDESLDPSQATSLWRDMSKNLDQFAGDPDDKLSNFNPYTHSLFANDASESVARERRKESLAPYRNFRWHHQDPRFFNTHEKAVYLANKDARPLHMDDGYKQSHRFHHPGSHTDQEDMDSLQASERYHEGRHYEGLDYFSSPSKKVIHIHTKEKKGHGKYLWPILGGGLTMLMGFLIISNMLLSIPLLAMGASTLFGHGGFHTQQLVPVYNLSQLRPPTGRRRKRWIDGFEDRLGSTSLAARSITLRDFAFKNMLRRILTSLAVRGNRCKAHF